MSLDSYHKLTQEVALFVNEHVRRASAGENVHLHEMTRNARLKFGVGSTTIKRILREDYPSARFVDGLLVLEE